jgi:hypothetical protein
VVNNSYLSFTAANSHESEELQVLLAEVTSAYQQNFGLL